MDLIADLLKHNPLFSSLSEQHREKIAPHMTSHLYSANENIFKQGDVGDSLYVIKSGSVGVFIKDSALGIVQMVARFESPEAFGEMAIITGEKRTATCTALEPTTLYRLSSEMFEMLIKKMPQVAIGVAKTLADRLHKTTSECDVPWKKLTGLKVKPELWAMARDSVWNDGEMAPVKLDGRTLTVAIVDPYNTSAINSLRQAIAGIRIKIVAAGAKDIQLFTTPVSDKKGTKKANGNINIPKKVRPSITFLDDEESRTTRGIATPMASMTGPQIIELADEIVSTGLAAGASDIHIEQERETVVVRYRIEGKLKSREGVIPGDMGRPLASRIKLLAKLDITETRKPQDGRISVQVDDRLVDLRVSTMDSKFGEKIVMRILDAEMNIVDLKTIIVQDKVRQFFSEMIFRPNGLILVTGPTGSGKTTTMYAGLMARRRPELNLVTVEDPIEYHLDGTTQVQVQPEIGTTFGVVLRALLRQDPDIIMVGETRDDETARMAVEASMTGHLVLTSLHTNGAVESVLRMLDLQVDKFALANTLAGVLHQRLVRRCCPDCTEPFEYPAPIVDRLFAVGAFKPNEKPILYRGKGCSKCNGTGYKGRVALLELLVVNDAVKQAISDGADMHTLKEVAKQGALVELARYAGILVGTGATTPGEVLHLIQSVN